MSRLVPAPNPVRDDHRELLSLIDAVRRRFSAPPWQEPMLGSLLQSLIDHLEAHFQNEERGGFFDEVLDLAPHTSPRIDALINEHQRMLMLADNLMHRHARLRRTPANWRQQGEAFERLREMLLVHECEERSLLQEAFVRDEGSKD